LLEHDDEHDDGKKGESAEPDQEPRVVGRATRGSSTSARPSDDGNGRFRKVGWFVVDLVVVHRVATILEEGREPVFSSR
jgi:hypothetical protein